MQPVGVGIGQNNDLSVAQPAQVIGAGVNAYGHRQVVDFLRLENLARLAFPGVQDFSAQRHDGLEFPVARLLGAAAGRIAFNQKNFGLLQVGGGAVGKIVGQCGGFDDYAASNLGADEVVGMWSM